MDTNLAISVVTS